MQFSEKDNFEEVTVKAKVARKDKDGRRVKEVVDGKKVTVYDEVEKTIKKDAAEQTSCKKTDAESSLSCKRSCRAGKKRSAKEVDLVDKLFNEYRTEIR